MEEQLLKTIREISERKAKAGIEPAYALRLEIDKAVNDAINSLYKKGLIDAGQTLNDKWIKAK